MRINTTEKELLIKKQPYEDFLKLYFLLSFFQLKKEINKDI